MEKNNINDFPHDFRCPISMELMKDPVTISTGVTYDRKSIVKWFDVYKKKTCPATMQCVDNFDMTPNLTLKRLILAWLENSRADGIRCSTSAPSAKHEELVTLLDTIELTPFKVTSLKKLRSIMEVGDEIKEEFTRTKGVEVLVKIITNILVENSDFTAFRACEEALSVLHQIPFSDEDDEKTLQLLTNVDCMNSMTFMLQSGSAETRFYIISILQKLAKADSQFNIVIENQEVEFFKSLLEISSDEIYTKASSRALHLLLQLLDMSKKSRLRVIDAGAIHTLIELLPDANGSKCEKIMMIITCLCECAEGRLGFIEHELGIAAVCKKMLNVSHGVTKVGVKIFWLISSFHGSERVLEEMLVCGAVKKIVALLHVGGGESSGTRRRVVKMLKMHGRTWQSYPCFPNDWKAYLGSRNDF